MNTTLRKLDIGSSEVSGTAPSSLDSWYDRVRDVPISEFSNDDLCRACRQNIHLAHVLPIALERLSDDPATGSMFDGELASVIARIPESFWADHKELATRTQTTLRTAAKDCDDDIRKEIEEFLANKHS